MDGVLEVLINNAMDRCNYKVIRDSSYYKGFWLIYPFTTENIKGYIDYFDLDGRSLMTVGSSLDQVFNARLRGCKDITVVDINPYTKFYYYLKLAALLCLDRKGFLHFLRYVDYPKVFKDNKYVFDKEVFNSIKSILKLLDYDSYLLWDKIFSTYSSSRIRKTLFSLDEYRTYQIERINEYLSSDDKYEELRYLILDSEINFITGDLSSIKLDRSFDNIWLSNIGNYLKLSELRELVDHMDKYLNKDGDMLMAYLYETIETSRYHDGDCEIYDLDRTYEALKGYDFKMKSFVGVDGIKFGGNIKDSVLVYKKK